MPQLEPESQAIESQDPLCIRSGACTVFWNSARARTAARSTSCPAGILHPSTCHLDVPQEDCELSIACRMLVREVAHRTLAGTEPAECSHAQA